MTLAFPSAEGFGKNTIGGRGGSIYAVTNLDNSGPGSLREGCEATGPRIVVFRIGGTINLLSAIIVSNPYLTIAGQTAPGGGIALKADPSYEKALLRVEVSEFIVRYIRFRRGAHTVLGSDGDNIVIGRNGAQVHNVIADHCSFSWAVDENFDIWYDSHDITVQWCIFSEGLKNSTHLKGEHSAAFLAGSTCDRISIHHNLFAHNSERCPRLGSSGIFDVVNNLVYNCALPNAEEGWGPSHNEGSTNYVGNYLKAGPDTVFPSYYISGGGPKYVKGNITPLRPIDEGNEVIGVIRSSNQDSVVSSPFPVEPISCQLADDVYDQILAEVGANRSLNANGAFTNNRDSVDSRIIEEVKSGTGFIIDSPDDVGGWPFLIMGDAYVDTDGDGISDEWEEAQGLDPNDPSDGPINIERFLNGRETMSVITDLQAIETALRAEALAITAQADAVAQAIVDLKAVDDVLDAAADVIEAD